MASARPAMPMIIEVTFEHRDDGGLRAYAEGVPGFVLSNRNPDLVLSDVAPVLETILSEILGSRVVVSPMVDVAEAIGSADTQMPAHLCHKPYLGQPIAA